MNHFETGANMIQYETMLSPKGGLNNRANSVMTITQANYILISNEASFIFG